LRILISNDDGYRATGILALRSALADLADVTVVAPDRNRSGASNSLTLDVPLRVFDVESGVKCVIGTPTDCVHLSLSGLFDQSFDMVVSGINDGANLGDDVLYSGTVAAAIEGRFLGLPTVALSLCGKPGAARHFETAASIARRIVAGLLREPLESQWVLNVNVPDLPLSAIKGVLATRLGQRHPSRPAIEAADPHGRPVYWIGPSGAGNDAGEGTDFHAVANGFVSVTPLTVDMTRHTALPAMRNWLAQHT
jgi:5'-nucleotidase